MTQTKFTPGPWHWDWSIPCVGDLKAEDGFILEFCDYEGLSFASPNGDQDEANAHLIAAAPELYEALEQLVAIIEKAGIHNLMNGVQLGPVVWAVKAEDARAYANEVLAKARGES